MSYFNQEIFHKCLDCLEESNLDELYCSTYGTQPYDEEDIEYIEELSKSLLAIKNLRKYQYGIIDEECYSYMIVNNILQKIVDVVELDKDSKMKIEDTISILKNLMSNNINIDYNK